MGKTEIKTQAKKAGNKTVFHNHYNKEFKSYMSFFFLVSDFFS